MANGVPQRGDGFDTYSGPGGPAGGSGNPSSDLSSLNLSAVRGMSLPQIMHTFNVDQNKAQIIKDAVAGAPAGALAGLAVHFLGDVIGEEWAGALGGALGGLLGGLAAKHIKTNEFRGKPRKRSY